MWLYYFWSLLPRWGWLMLGTGAAGLIGKSFFQNLEKVPVWQMGAMVFLLIAVVLVTVLATFWPEKRYQSL